MALATWWRGDSVPALTPLQNFYAGPTKDAELLARLANLELAEVQTRLAAGHRPYVAWLDREAVAYGWVATHTAYVGELELTITLPPANCYLWDFATLPQWRGRGIYPRLLQAILARESALSDRFWIIAASENRASSAGIAKAGFTQVAHLSFQWQGEPALVPMVAGERVAVAATLLQVAVLDGAAEQVLSPCWHCAMDARAEGQAVTDAACWPDPAKAELVLANCQCG
jgi:GNAT superfamily N-acetyltransferase